MGSLSQGGGRGCIWQDRRGKVRMDGILRNAWARKTNTMCFFSVPQSTTPHPQCFARPVMHERLRELRVSQALLSYGRLRAVLTIPCCLLPVACCLLPIVRGTEYSVLSPSVIDTRPDKKRKQRTCAPSGRKKQVSISLSALRSLFTCVPSPNQLVRKDRKTFPWP